MILSFADIFCADLKIISILKPSSLMTGARYLKWITKFMIDIYLGRNNFLTLRDCFHSILIHFAISGRYFIQILQQTKEFLFFLSLTRVVMNSDADCVLVFLKGTTDGGLRRLLNLVGDRREH